MGREDEGEVEAKYNTTQPGMLAYKYKYVAPQVKGFRPTDKLLTSYPVPQIVLVLGSFVAS
jgi:hypothetical protein